jgi:hypothetical protein
MMVSKSDDAEKRSGGCAFRCLSSRRTVQQCWPDEGVAWKTLSSCMRSSAEFAIDAALVESSLR